MHVVGGSFPEEKAVGGSVLEKKTAATKKRARGFRVTRGLVEPMPVYPENAPILTRTARQFEMDVRRAVKRRLARDMAGIHIEGPIVRVGLSGARHEFDIWYSFRLGHIEHHVVWEARCRNRPLSKEQVAAFIGKIRDLPERPTGAMVSLHGYQKGAKQLALANGIHLYRLEHFSKGRPVICLENPAVSVAEEFFHVRIAPTLSLAFADMIAQALEDTSESPIIPAASGLAARACQRG